MTSGRARRSSSPAATPARRARSSASATAARELGYDALLLSAPHTSLPSQARARAPITPRSPPAVGLPIILYNYPARAGVEIGFECLDAIADLPEIVAIKESSGDFSRFLTLRRRYHGPDRGHVRLGRPGRRLLLVGRAQLARRHGQRAAATARRGARRRAAGRPRARPSAVRGDAALGAEHGERQLQPEGEARARAPRHRLRLGASAAPGARSRRLPPRPCGCSTRRSRSSFPNASRQADVRLAQTLTAVETHAEGEQGTVYLGSVFDAPGRHGPREAAPRQRGRRLASAASSASSRAAARRRARTSCSPRATPRPMPASSSCSRTAPTR